MSATVSIPRAKHWLPNLLTGRPHQIIAGTDGRPYLQRWYLIPRNRVLNVYLHRFLSSDDPTLHDHPWAFLSCILSGTYEEVTAHGRHARRRGSTALRRATHRHSIVLPRDHHGREIPCVTIIITGPHRRDWGFWCTTTNSGPAGQRFIPWRHFGVTGCDAPAPIDPLLTHEEV